MITIETNKGNIELELDEKNTPISAQNFIDYVKEGFFDGTIFHRVIKGFMIQGGGFTETMEQKQVKEPINNEAKNAKANKKGTISMARTNDPNSATSQFFINVADNDFLNYSSDSEPGYCVFGEVTSGLDIVEKISLVATTVNSGHSDVPQETIEIIKVTL